jgi:hypothetical protein
MDDPAQSNLLKGIKKYPGTPVRVLFSIWKEAIILRAFRDYRMERFSCWVGRIDDAVGGRNVSGASGKKKILFANPITTRYD